MRKRDLALILTQASAFQALGLGRSTVFQLLPVTLRWSWKREIVRLARLWLPGDRGGSVGDAVAGTEPDLGSAHVGPDVVGPDELEVGAEIGPEDALVGPALGGTGLHARGEELPAVGVSGAAAGHTGPIAGQEEVAVLAQGEAPGLVHGLGLAGVRRGVVLEELVGGVVAHVVAPTVAAVARAMIALQGVVPGVLLGGQGACLEGGHPEAAGPLAGGHHHLDVLAKGQPLDLAGPAVEDLDRGRWGGDAGPAGAGRASGGRRRADDGGHGQDREREDGAEDGAQCPAAAVGMQRDREGRGGAVGWVRQSVPPWAARERWGERATMPHSTGTGRRTGDMVTPVRKRARWERARWARSPTTPGDAGLTRGDDADGHG